MIDMFQTQKQAERSSGVVEATLRDEAGAPVTAASVASLTLTLYDQATRAIINGRRAQNALNANNVTMGVSDGLVTWAVQPSDTTCVSGGNEEVHVALFTARWAGGAKEHSWMVLLPIENLAFISGGGVASGAGF